MNSKNIALYILYSILIAGVYYGVGVSVRPLILPPSFIAPIWPSAGIAVGVIILWGKRFLPAILIGEALLSMSFYQFDDLIEKPILIITYIAMLVSTGIRCLLGAYLVNRHLGKSNNYLTLESVLKLLLLAGVIPTFISSFISIMALASNGMVEENTLLINFSTWWFGDAVGVFLILPIMFLIFKQPRTVWKPRLYKTVIPVAITFSLLLLIAFNFKYFEHERLNEKLNDKIETLIDATIEQYSSKHPAYDWIPNEQAKLEINKLFTEVVNDLIIIEGLGDVHFIISSIEKNRKIKLFESSNNSFKEGDWNSHERFKYASNEWQLEAYATTEYFYNNASWLVWWLLSIGFLFISILGSALLVITGNNIRIQDQVVIKTKEINELFSILKESEHKYKQLIEIQPVIFWRYIVGEKKLDYVSEEAVNVLGYSKEELMDVELVLDKMFHPNDRTRIIKEFYKGIESKNRFMLKYKAQTITGEEIWFKDFISSKIIDGKIEVLGLKVDITEDQEKERKISQLAFFDSMTKLPNRVRLMEYLRKFIDKAKKNDMFGASLSLDIDRFKVVNDSLGYYFGDKLLIQISKRLKKVLNKHDVVARVGGDEFVILIGKQYKTIREIESKVNKVIKKIQINIGNVFRIEEQNIYASFSYGVSIFPENSQNATEILQQTDTAMYFAKAQGTNSVSFFKNEMKRDANRRLKIEKSLKIALIRQEYEMYYQPIFNGNKEIIKYESLIRWNHPRDGLKTPESFIKTAEETGFIIELSEWVIDNVFEYIQKLGINNQPILPISINISLLQFEDSGFVSILKHTSNKYKINNSKVILELTESIGIGDFEATLNKMNQIKKLGFKIAIDDFGTGYSSLNYLTKMPIDILKLDKSFVTKIGRGISDDALVETIVLMAKHLKLDLIVEGVETLFQFEFLKKLGCHQFQGYLVAKAMSIEDLDKYMLGTQID